ncbi:MAG: NTP transferase domain-containing protein, partial [Bacteroidetes bacterium]|nr:NTP transferase domain-containing protein [Bacteroidota bacterium]
MNAIILAAGLGTRLRPLTLDRPKALVEIDGIPMLELTIHRLRNAGFTHIVINVHHFHDRIKSFLESNIFSGVRIDISDESSLLLDTGGGIKKASLFLQKDTPILVHNVDVFTDLDFSEMMAWHKKNQA